MYRVRKNKRSFTCGVAAATPCFPRLTPFGPSNYPRRERRTDLKLETAASKLFAVVIAAGSQIEAVSRSNHHATTTPPLFVYAPRYYVLFVCKTNDRLLMNLTREYVKAITSILSALTRSVPKEV